MRKALGSNPSVSISVFGVNEGCTQNPRPNIFAKVFETGLKPYVHVRRVHEKACGDGHGVVGVGIIFLKLLLTSLDGIGGKPILAGSVQ